MKLHKIMKQQRQATSIETSIHFGKLNASKNIKSSFFPQIVSLISILYTQPLIVERYSFKTHHCVLFYPSASSTLNRSFTTILRVVIILSGINFIDQSINVHPSIQYLRSSIVRQQDSLFPKKSGPGAYFRTHRSLSHPY